MKHSGAAVMAFALLILLPAAARAQSGCPSMNVNDVLNDPRVQDALDEAWRDSLEGTPDEREEGGYIQQCRNVNAITGEETYFTQILRWPHGTFDSSAPSYPPRQSDSCRTVATFHTHPGPDRGAPGADGHDNPIPSPDDYRSAANDGLPGIIRWGTGDDTTDFTYNYGSVGDEPREPGWLCPAKAPPARGYGDPHMLTLDGLAYDFMAIGDFILMTTAQGDVEIQARLQPYGPTASAAVTTGIAVRDRRDRVEWLLDGRRLIINGAARQLQAGQRVQLRSGAVVRSDSDGLLFLSSSGDRLRVYFNTDAIDYSLYLATRRAGSARGLFGNFDGDPDNDLRSAGGQVITLVAGEPPNYQRPLYERFGESWRVAPAASLFSTPYVPPNGVDVKTFPRPAPPGASRAAAEAACKSVGIVDASVFEACVFDYVQSGGPSFMASAAAADRDIRSGVPLAAGGVAAVERDTIGRLEGQTREVVYTITLTPGTYLLDGRGSHGTLWRLEAANGDNFLAGMQEMAANPRRVTLPGGRYQLKIAVLPELSAGRFRFRVRRPAEPEISPLQPGQRVSGRIDLPGQTRLFQLQLQPGRYDFVPKSDGELWWSLTGKDGYDRFDANQRVFMERAAGLEITSAGTYTLLVGGREWVGTGSYEIGFTRMP